MACYRFQADVKLWLSYVEFCKTRVRKIYVLIQPTIAIRHFRICTAKWQYLVCTTMAERKGVRFEDICTNVASAQPQAR